MNCDHCPLKDRACRSYPVLCRNMAADPARWRPVLDQVNGDEPSPPEYPPLPEMAANYARATVEYAASGFAKVDPAEFDRRMAICKACDFFDAARERCRACGCPTNRKLVRAVSKCPKGFWA